MGATIENLHGNKRRDVTLFGERQGQVVLSASPANVESIVRIAQAHGLVASEIGTVTGDRLILGDAIDASVEELFSIYSQALPAAMGEEEVVV